MSRLIPAILTIISAASIAIGAPPLTMNFQGSLLDLQRLSFGALPIQHSGHVAPISQFLEPPPYDRAGLSL